MNLLIRALLPIILASLGGPLQEGPIVKVDRPQTASVAGRVTIGDSPVAGVQVALVRTGDYRQGEKNISRAKTDQDGRYLLDSLAAGYYAIEVLAPTMAVQGQGYQGRRITLQAATKLENIDFALIPGGVITGRVTDGDGSPVTDLAPTLKAVDEKGRSTVFSPCPQESRTDDRGIYRIYGLPPGRYIIGFGLEWDGPSHGQNEQVVSRRLYPLTYYPGVLDEARSKTIEVTAGSELTGIDISLTAKTLFKATGTVVDAETSAPLAGAVVSHGMIRDNGGEWSGDSVRSDADGRFKFARLQPGKHFLNLSNEDGNGNNRFGDQITFEVADSDVEGLEVKVHHGSTISGVIIPVSPNDEKIAAAMAHLEVYAIQLSADPLSGALRTNWVAQAPIATDRSFRLAGLPPGKYRLQLPNDGEAGFCISYIDVPKVGRLMNQAPYPPGSFDGDPIEITEGQNLQAITGVRIAVSAARSVIRGQIKYEGGPLPQNALISVSIVMLPASDTRQYAGAAVDPEGHFVIRSLVAGQYKIMAAAYLNPSAAQKDGGIKVLGRTSETVSIADGQETTVTLTLNLGGR